VHISHLSLKDFRSYEVLDLPLTKGQIIFVGENGEGKTNIIESVMYLSLLSSHRISQDTPLIKLGADKAYIRAKIEEEGRTQLLELEINIQKANRAKINQNPVRSQQELNGICKAICFSPEDLDLVRGDPIERRRFLDQLLTQRSPRTAGVITDYERTVKQRNALLKSRASNLALQPWDEHLANFGGDLIAARLDLITSLKPYFVQSYKKLSDKKVAEIQYKSTIANLTTDKERNKTLLLSRINEVRDQERERGITLVGPHRDDLLLILGDHPVKSYASHGEAWSIALALRLASYQLLVAEGSRPLLVLDDVFSELDERRRDHLVALAEEADQTFITVAVENDLPPALQGKKYKVQNGSVAAI